MGALTCLITYAIHKKCLFIHRDRQTYLINSQFCKSKKMHHTHVYSQNCALGMECDAWNVEDTQKHDKNSLHKDLNENMVIVAAASCVQKDLWLYRFVTFQCQPTFPLILCATCYFTLVASGLDLFLRKVALAGKFFGRNFSVKQAKCNVLVGIISNPPKKVDPWFYGSLLLKTLEGGCHGVTYFWG